MAALAAHAAPRRFVPDSAGSAIVEMAIALPAFTLLLFAIFQFAMALTSYLGAAYAIRTTARIAATRSVASLNPISTTQIQTLVKANSFVPASSAVAITYYGFKGSSSGNYPGNVVGISIQYNQTIAAPFYSNTFVMASTCYRVITH